MLNKLEKKFGKFAISNLTLYLLVGYAIGYMLQFGEKYTGVPYLSYLTLEPYKIIHELQMWRIFTWVLVPPNIRLIWAIFMFMLYYSLGGALENTWGTFRFNVYIFGGIIFTIIGAFLTYFLYGAYYGAYPIDMGSVVSTYYINLSIFLAFSMYFPDMQLLVYFVIPVKMKWLSILYVAVLGYEVAGYLLSPVKGSWVAAVPIIMSLLNFIIFYLSTRNYRRFDPKEIHRRAEFKRQATPPPTQYRDGSPIARHKCAVCGRTEVSNPELEFRFCSKCSGNYEYCSEHLFTHTHIKN